LRLKRFEVGEVALAVSKLWKLCQARMSGRNRRGRNCGREQVEPATSNSSILPGAGSVKQSVQ
jgi:hypothetical protein